MLSFSCESTFLPAKSRTRLSEFSPKLFPSFFLLFDVYNSLNINSAPKHTSLSLSHPFAFQHKLGFVFWFCFPSSSSLSQKSTNPCPDSDLKDERWFLSSRVASRSLPFLSSAKSIIDPKSKLSHTFHHNMIWNKYLFESKKKSFLFSFHMFSSPFPSTRYIYKLTSFARNESESEKDIGCRGRGALSNWCGVVVGCCCQLSQFLWFSNKILSFCNAFIRIFEFTHTLPPPLCFDGALKWQRASLVYWDENIHNVEAWQRRYGIHIFLHFPHTLHDIERYSGFFLSTLLSAHPFLPISHFSLHIVVILTFSQPAERESIRHVEAYFLPHLRYMVHISFLSRSLC